jgi:hypothetical protein
MPARWRLCKKAGDDDDDYDDYYDYDYDDDYDYDYCRENYWYNYINPSYNDDLKYLTPFFR